MTYQEYIRALASLPDECTRDPCKALYEYITDILQLELDMKVFRLEGTHAVLLKVGNFSLSMAEDTLVPVAHHKAAKKALQYLATDSTALHDLITTALDQRA
jgi:hypothetical protein